MWPLLEAAWAVIEDNPWQLGDVTNMAKFRKARIGRKPVGPRKTAGIKVHRPYTKRKRSLSPENRARIKMAQARREKDPKSRSYWQKQLASD